MTPWPSACAGAGYASFNIEQEAAYDRYRFPNPLGIRDRGAGRAPGGAHALELRERHGARGIPAVALTAYVSPPDRYAVVAAGFDVHVPKPVDV